MWVLADENDDIYVVEKGDTLAIISKKCMEMLVM